MRPRALERLDVVSEPAFVTNLQDVSPANMAKNIAPVIVVLNEIALGEADAVAHALSGNAHAWNGEVTRFPEKALDAILGKDGFVQGCRTEVMGPVQLKSALNSVLCRRELRDNVWIVLMGKSAEETAIDTVL